MLTYRTLIRCLTLLALLLAPFPQANVPMSPVIQPEAQPSNTIALPLEAQTSISTVIGRDDTAYHLTPSAADEATAAYQATNSAQNLQAQFTSEAVLLQSNDQQWDMHLRAWGRGQNLAVLKGAVLQAVDNRIEYQYAELSEWYVNGPYGLQQGFTLRQPPLADSADEPLALNLDLADYRAQLDADGKGATLSTPDGASSLRYAGLLAYDADGRALSTWLELIDGSGSALNIRVADAGARYPLTVDPLVQQVKLIAADAPGDSFGISVALSRDGNTALIGADAADVLTKTYQGVAYVFTRSGYAWNLQAKLSADLSTFDGETNDFFGISVALSDNGNTALIGAHQADVAGKSEQGAAYVFTRAGSTWSAQTRLVPVEGVAFDYIGRSVALSGDGNTALISADATDANGHTNEGAAYVFARSGSSWTQQGRLIHSSMNYAYMGHAVALSQDGNTALLGAVGYGSSPANRGAAFTFTRTGTTWAYEDDLLATGGLATDNFGYSVALSDDGNTALIGASGATVDGKDDQGAAYIFTRSNHVWTQQTRLIANDGEAGDKLGCSVALLGNGAVAYVGAYQDTVDTYPRQGSVYHFTKSGSTWLPPNKVVASSGFIDDEFGIAVAVSGSTLLVGAHGYSGDRGAAYFFMPEGSGTREVKVTGSGNADDRLGISVAVSDSGNTVLVGAYLADVDGNVDQGAAYAFLHSDSAATWRQAAKLVAPDGAADDRFGWSVAVSGDGSTGVVGAYQADVNGKADAGAAYVFIREFLGGVEYQGKLTGAEVAGDHLGYAVALNDDGNVAVLGAIGHNSDQGRAFIYTRSGTTWTNAQTLLAFEGETGDVFGRSVALSADGLVALVGASRVDVGTATDQGAAYVFRKTSENWVQEKQMTDMNGAAGDLLGVSVALSENGNRALLGAYQGEDGPGKAVFFEHSSGGWGQGETLRAPVGSLGDLRYGVSVALSGDGQLAVVGADQATMNGHANQGAVYVYKYTPAPAVLSPQYTPWKLQPILTDGIANDYFGFSVAANEDGSVVTVGAYGVNVGQNNAQGAAYVYLFQHQVFLPAILR